MNLNTISNLSKKFNVRVSTHKEKGKRVLGLHGQLSDVQSLAAKIKGYWIEKTDTGYFLYSERAIWE